jgi:hypothetical protein
MRLLQSRRGDLLPRRCRARERRQGRIARAVHVPPSANSIAARGTIPRHREGLVQIPRVGSARRPERRGATRRRAPRAHAPAFGATASPRERRRRLFRAPSTAAGRRRARVVHSRSERGAARDRGRGFRIVRREGVGMRPRHDPPSQIPVHVAGQLRFPPRRRAVAARQPATRCAVPEPALGRHRGEPGRPRERGDDDVGASGESSRCGDQKIPRRSGAGPKVACPREFRGRGVPDSEGSMGTSKSGRMRGTRNPAVGTFGAVELPTPIRARGHGRGWTFLLGRSSCGPWASARPPGSDSAAVLARFFSESSVGAAQPSSRISSATPQSFMRAISVTSHPR